MKWSHSRIWISLQLRVLAYRWEWCCLAAWLGHDLGVLEIRPQPSHRIAGVGHLASYHRYKTQLSFSQLQRMLLERKFPEDLPNFVCDLSPGSAFWVDCDHRLNSLKRHEEVNLALDRDLLITSLTKWSLQWTLNSKMQWQLGSKVVPRPRITCFTSITTA